MNNEELEALAAEYVLGTLDFDERRGAAALLEVDPLFRGIVRIWERRLGELHLMVEPVEPDAQIWDRIRDQVVAIAPGTVFEPVPAPEEPPAEAATIADAQAIADAAPGPAVMEPTGDAAAASVPDAVASADLEPGQATAVPSIDADAAANLMRELEEAARLVPTAEPAADTSSPLRDAETGAALQEPAPRFRRWRLLAIMMSVVSVVLAGLIGAWRFIPDQLPPSLQATYVLHLPVLEPPPPPLPPPRREPPPSFDE
jgi:hypothetical protein